MGVAGKDKLHFVPSVKMSEEEEPPTFLSCYIDDSSVFPDPDSTEILLILDLSVSVVPW